MHAACGRTKGLGHRGPVAGSAMSAAKEKGRLPQGLPDRRDEDGGRGGQMSAPHVRDTPKPVCPKRAGGAFRGARGVLSNQMVL